MKAPLGLCLAVSLTVMAAAHRHKSTAPPRSSNTIQSSAPRGFLFYVKERMKSVCLEITELKEKMKDCCSQAGQCRGFNVGWFNGHFLSKF